jgi:hypothetical protein
MWGALRTESSAQHSNTLIVISFKYRVYFMRYEYNDDAHHKLLSRTLLNSGRIVGGREEAFPPLYLAGCNGELLN